MNKVIYFNNAASGWPKAPGVEESILESLRNPPYHPGRSIGQISDPMMECRYKLASLLGVSSPSQIILTTSATHSFNIVLWGLRLKKGDKVITTVTEHNSLLRPLYHLKEKYGIDIIFIGIDDYGNLNKKEFDDLIDENVKLVAINHASNVTGKINDIQPIFSKAKDYGAITLLDASQSLGHVQINVDEIYADIVIFTGHKALHGPSGTGGFYISPSVELEQVFVGGTGVRSDLMLHPQEMPTRYEAGTPNLPAFSGLAKALDWHSQNHKDFCKKANDLTNELIKGLSDIPKVEIFSNFNDSARVPIVSFRIKGWKIEETGYILNQSFGIICRSGLHCAPLIHKAIGSFPDGTIRFSLSEFNTNAEVETAIDAVKKIAK